MTESQNAVRAGSGPFPHFPERGSAGAPRSSELPGDSQSFRICDRCGDILLDKDGGACRCTTPYDRGEMQRRHRHAVRRAQMAPIPEHVTG